MNREELIDYLTDRLGYDRATVTRFVDQLPGREREEILNQVRPEVMAAPLFRDFVQTERDAAEAQQQAVEQVQEQTGLDEEEAAEVVKESEDFNEKVDELQAQGDIAGLQALLQGQLPGGGSQWVKETFGNVEVSEEEQRDILDAYADLTGEELEWFQFEATIDSDLVAQQAFAIGFQGATNNFVQVQTSRGPFHVSAEAWQAASEHFDNAVQDNMLGKVVAAAHEVGITEQGDNNWWWLAAAAANAGLFGPVDNKPIMKDRFTPEQKATLSAATGGKGVGGPQVVDEEATAARRMGREFSRGMRLWTLAKELSGFHRRYGDYGLALVALEDEALAEAIYENGGVDPTQANQVRRILAKIDPQLWEAVQAELDPQKFDALTNPLSPTGAARFGQRRVDVVNLPSRAGIEEATRSLYQAWFLGEPSPEELARFTSEIESFVWGEAQKEVNAYLRENPIGNIFKGSLNLPKGQESILIGKEQLNAEAEILKKVRATPKYRKLFGKKDPDMSERDYVEQFRIAATTLLGPGATPIKAIQAGMEAGSAATTSGQIFGSKEALDNSTFMQRAARAAEIFNRMT